MKNKFKLKLIFLVFLSIQLSCKNETNINKESVNQTSTDKSNNTNIVEKKVNIKNTTIEESFKMFCKNITQKNEKEILMYFNYPIPNSDVFYLEPLIDFNTEINSQEKVNLNFPLSKEDFQKNYNYIFSNDFINGIKKISDKNVFEEGKFETELIQKKENTKYSLSFEYDKNKKQIILILSYIFIEEGEKYESSIFYYLDYLDNNFKISKILMAG
jgi:hypothetical protein